MRRYTLAWITSFSTAVAAEPVPLQWYFAIIFPYRPSLRWREPDATSDRRGAHDVSLIITGGLRRHTDFAKAMALGADAVAVSNSAMQAIGCIGMRACASNACPVGIATQNEALRARLPVDEAADRLQRYFEATTELMSVLARAMGHTHISQFTVSDLTTFDREMAHLTGIAYGGVTL